MGNNMQPQHVNENAGVSEVAQKVEEAGRLSKYYKNSSYYFLNFERVAKRKIVVTVNGDSYLMTYKEFNKIYHVMLDMLPDVLDSKVCDLQPSYDVDVYCEICFEKFKTQNVKGLTCGHGPYHEPCIRKWMKIGHTCPMCRKMEYITNWAGKDLKSNLNTTINTFISLIKGNSKLV